MMTSVQAAANEQIPAIGGRLSPLVMPSPEKVVSCAGLEEAAIIFAAQAAKNAYAATAHGLGREALRAIFRQGAVVGAFTVSETGASMIKSSGPLSVAELVRVRALD